MKRKISNVPFGPYITVLAGAFVNNKPNYTTIGAYGVVSQKPVLYISLKNTHHTTAGVIENGYFSVNIPSGDFVGKTDYCGTVSGSQVDKSEVFESFYDEDKKAPMIQECPVNYLCRVIQTIPIFDFTMFLGEIVAVYANEDCIDNNRPDALKVNPIVLMDTGYFNLNSRIGSIFKACKGNE